MTHSQIVKLIKKKGYFKIQELVDERTYNKYGERAWRFLQGPLLETIYFIRHKSGKSIVVNNWHKGGTLDERGLRTNVCDIVKGKTKKNSLYLSAHVRGGALDFNMKGMSAPQVRRWLVSIADELPYKIRLENTLGGKQISWVHIDMDSEDKNPKVYLMAI